MYNYQIKDLVKIPMPMDLHIISLPSGRMIHCRNLEEAKRIYTDIFVDKIYKLPFNRELNPKRIVDIGAHIGFATLWFAEQYPEAKIESYEPNPFNFQLLTYNTRDLRDRISVYPCAINTCEEQTCLYLGNGKRAGWTWGGSLIKNHWHKDQNKIPFTMPTILSTEICHSKIDLLKVDIEGLEYDLFFH
jgi:FkbM family methyltransferase